jgi:predicted amidophosphoribosyltransferase
MRIDSCRKCGKELQVMQLCSNCDQPLHFECKNCKVYIDDPIHQHENSSQLLAHQSGVYVN